MLTKIILDGPLGKLFGKEWNLAVSSPNEALRLIDANKPGLRKWLVSNRETFDGYRVTCTYESGVEEDLDDNSYLMLRKNLVSIRFTPIPVGASSTLKMIVGVVLIVVGVVYSNPWLVKAGAVLLLGGVIEALSARPKTKSNNGDDISSYYFDGPTNTERQGSPVPLIYGRVMAGSHAISASINTDDVRKQPPPAPAPSE